jgi:hypothetical protein
MAGLLLLWLVIEGICGILVEKRVALFSNNMPTVAWVLHLASQKSLAAEHFVQALILQLKTNKTCQLTTLHIEGKQNAIADIPSRSFGSNPAWHCISDSKFLTLLISMFPCPAHKSWTVFHPSYKMVTRMISMLRTQHSELDEWRRLPRIGNHVGNIGNLTSNLWEWNYIYRLPCSSRECNISQDLRPEDLWPESHLATTERESKSKLVQCLAGSQPLARKLYWTQTTTPPR